MQYVDHSSQLELNSLFLSALSETISEPEYHPTSPDYQSNEDIVQGELRPLYNKRSLKNQNRVKIPEPRNINDFKTPRDLEEERLLKDKSTKQFKPPNKKKRNKRQEAIDLFDVNAKPKKINEFIREVLAEEFLPPVNIIEKENLSVERIETIEDPVLHEQLAIAEIVTAKHNSDLELDKNYGLNLKFDNDIESQYIRSLNVDPSDYDLTDSGYRCPITSIYNKELFIQRRLFSTLEHLQFSDPDFLKRHLPVHVDLSNVDHTKLVNDDENSIGLLKEYFLSNFNDNITTSKLLKDNQINVKQMEKLFPFKKARRLQNYLVVSYLVLNDPKLIKDRTKLVETIHPAFNKHVFRKSTIKSCFNACGIGFFDDYLSFNVIKPYIANLTEDRHGTRMKQLKKAQKAEVNKKKKESPGLEEYWFSNELEDGASPPSDSLTNLFSFH